jgi:hypothetical protein
MSTEMKLDETDQTVLERLNQVVPSPSSTLSDSTSEEPASHFERMSLRLVR